MSCLIQTTLLLNSSWDISTGMWWWPYDPRWTRIRLMARSEYGERNLSIRCLFPTWVLCLVQRYSEHRQKKEVWTWSIWVFSAKYVGDHNNACSGHWRSRFSQAIETILDKYHEIFVEEEDDGEQQSWSLRDSKACFGLRRTRHLRTGLNAIERNTLFFGYPLWSVRLVLVMLDHTSVFKELLVPCLIDQSLRRYALCVLQQFVFMPLVPTLKMLKTKLKSKILSKAWEKRGKFRPRSAHSTGRPIVFGKNQNLWPEDGKLTQSSERKKRVSRQRLVLMAQSCLPNIVFSIHYAPVHIHPTNRTFPNLSSYFRSSNSLGQRDRKAFLNCWQGANSSPLALTHLW